MAAPPGRRNGNHTPPASVVGRAITAILEGIENSQTTTCLACGCLVTFSEVCPGCRARRELQRSHP